MSPESGVVQVTGSVLRRIFLERKSKRIRSIEYESMIDDITGRLSGLEQPFFHKQLGMIVMQYRMIECIYVIDENGIQVTGTVFREDVSMSENKLFKPDPSGTNQSYKNYFFNLMSGINRFTGTPLYIQGYRQTVHYNINSIRNKKRH